MTEHGLGFRIRSLYAFLALHPDGAEGVVGVLMPDGTTMPLVAADEARKDALVESAQAVANQSGLDITIARFMVRMDERVLVPGGSLTEFLPPPQPAANGGMSAYDREHIGDLIANVGGDRDWFTANLLRLIAKADTPHRERLRLAFPAEVEAFEKWQAGA